MSDKDQVVRVVTHSGFFHADEVFALAAVKLWLEREGKEINIIRSRDPKVIAEAEVVVDVGENYNPENKQFDHHQKGGAGKHENGIPYAAFGLVWKYVGEKITSQQAAAIVEKKLVMPIDAGDNGINLTEPLFADISEYSVFQVVSAIGKYFGDSEIDLAFGKAVGLATTILSGEIKSAETKIEGDRETEAQVVAQNEPEILILEKYIPWQDAVSRFKKVKLVIFPDIKSESRWCIQVAKDDPKRFGNDRINFPEKWRGLTDNALVDESGVAEASFCHSAGFFAVARSREGAFEMAKRVIKVCNLER